MAKDKRRFRLRNLNVDRADLVDIGANQEAHILLFKRAEVGKAFPFGQKPKKPIKDPEKGRPQKPVKPGDKEDEEDEEERAEAVPTRTQEASPKRAATPGDSERPNPSPPPPKPDGKQQPQQPSPSSATLSGKEAALVQNQARRDKIASALRAKKKKKRKVVREDEEVLEKIAQRTLNHIRKHYGPGDHPGTGTSQEEAHGSGKSGPQGTKGKSKQHPLRIRPLSKEEMTMSDIFSVVAKGLIDAGVFVDESTGDDLRAILPDEAIHEIETYTKSAGSASPPEEEDMANEDAPDLEAFDLEPEVREYISDLEAQVVRLSKSGTEEAPDQEEMIAGVLKSLDPAVAEIIKADRERLAEAEEALAEERSSRVRKAYEDKAETYEEIEDENLASVLHSVASFDPEVAANLETILDTVNKRLEAAALLDEIGSGGEEFASDALDKATAIAKSLVDNGDATDIEAARAMVWEANPDLFDEYQSERQQG